MSMLSLNILKQSPSTMLPDLLGMYNFVHPIDIKYAAKSIKLATKYYNGNHGISKHECDTLRLEDVWYDSLDEDHDTPNFDVYNDPYYFTDLWVCWCMYSRQYLRMMTRPKCVESHGVKSSAIEYLDGVTLDGIKSVVDLGCGLGISTVALSQLFPQATVWGTNIEHTRQYDFCEYLSGMYRIKMFGDPWPWESPDLYGADLVFASEYLEHILDAGDHIENICKHMQPQHICMANSFNTQSIGHFEYHYHGGERLPANKMARRVSKILKDHGYHKVKCKFWNGRPAIWSKTKP